MLCHFWSVPPLPWASGSLPAGCHTYVSHLWCLMRPVQIPAPPSSWANNLISAGLCLLICKMGTVSTWSQVPHEAPWPGLAPESSPWWAVGVILFICPLGAARCTPPASAGEGGMGGWGVWGDEPGAWVLPPHCLPHAPGPPTQRQSPWHFLSPPGRPPGPAPCLRKRISCLPEPG